MFHTEIHRGLTELHGGDSAGPTTQPPVELCETSVDLRVKHIEYNSKVLTSYVPCSRVGICREVVVTFYARPWRFFG